MARLEALTPPPNVSTATGFERSTAGFQEGIQRSASVPGSGIASSTNPSLNVSTTPVASRITPFATNVDRPPTASTSFSTPASANSSKTLSRTPMPVSQDPSMPDQGREAAAHTKTWTKMKPLGAQQVLLRPIRSDILPAPKENEPLFPGKEKHWYLGFVEHWRDFQKLTIDFHKSQEFQSGFDEIKGYPIGPPLATTLSQDVHYSELLTDYFKREVLEVVERICNKLLQTMTMQESDVPERILLGKATDEDLGNEDFAWNPDFVVRITTPEGEQETRLIGHAEYVGGKPGALTWAIQELVKNSWGSLRCVLGDIAQWMMMDNIRYAFLTSSDEIIFLKFDIVERVKYVNTAPRNATPDIDQVDVLKEPWLSYSDPIKFTDILDEAKGTVPVRLALLYLLHTSITSDWHLPDDMGSSRKYAAKTKAGEKYRQPPPDMSL
ncbi:Nn.00g071640.m01.CDS01 [Neocucurbitaria sp. VM-36]